MKKWTLFSLAFLFCGIAVFAQDKEGDLKKLFDVMGTETMAEEMIGEMMPLLTLWECKPDKEGEAKRNEYIKLLTSETRILIDKMLNEDLKKIFGTHFSHEEIVDLITFYESPTGQKFLQKTPEIGVEMMGVLILKHLPTMEKNIMNSVEKWEEK